MGYDFLKFPVSSIFIPDWKLYILEYYKNIHSKHPEWKSLSTTGNIDRINLLYLNEMVSVKKPLEFENNSTDYFNASFSPWSVKLIEKISSKLSLPVKFVGYYFRVLNDLVRKGKIHWRVLNPVEFVKLEKNAGELKEVSEKNPFNSIAETVSKNVRNIIIFIVIAYVIYMLGRDIILKKIG